MKGRGKQNPNYTHDIKYTHNVCWLKTRLFPFPTIKASRD